MDKIVGIGEFAISDNEDDKIKTFALASCVAVTVYDPNRKAAAMVHIALPCPHNPEDSQKNSPYYYACLAVPLLINTLCSKFGCSKNELKIKLFGGARSIRDDDLFNIGQKNIDKIVEVLSDLNLEYDFADIGGKISRTLEMDVATGTVKIFTQPITI